MEMDNKITVVFMPANTTSILQLMDQRAISTFKTYNLRNSCHEPPAAIDGDSSDGSGRNQLKTFWKEFTTLDVIKNTHDSRKHIKISMLTGVCQRLIPILMDDFEISVEEVTADVVEIVRELD